MHILVIIGVSYLDEKEISFIFFVLPIVLSPILILFLCIVARCHKKRKVAIYSR